MLVFLKDKRGATAIEYGLIAAGVALTIFSALYLFSDATIAMFDGLSNLLQTN